MRPLAKQRSQAVRPGSARSKGGTPVSVAVTLGFAFQETRYRIYAMKDQVESVLIKCLR